MAQMAIIIAGPPGVGKSTLVERLAKHFKAKPVFASGLMREIQEKQAQARVEDARKGEGFWESEEGKKLLKTRAEDGTLDKLLDQRLLEILKKEERVVMDSWTMPWLYKGSNAFKVWLTAPEDVRAKRIAERDKRDVKEVQEAIAKRLETTASIYKKLYGFELGTDLEPFDLLLDSREMSKEEVFENVKKAAEEHFS